MAQFEFGSVGTLSSTVTLQGLFTKCYNNSFLLIRSFSTVAFIVVVLFVIMFDAFIGVIEYLLGESKLYKRMIQTIYKELMLMG